MQHSLFYMLIRRAELRKPKKDNVRRLGLAVGLEKVSILQAVHYDDYRNYQQ